MKITQFHTQTIHVTFTIETQYRGLPHIHLIIWTDETLMNITNNEDDGNENDNNEEGPLYDISSNECDNTQQA